jgi:hypothetical protein
MSGGYEMVVGKYRTKHDEEGRVDWLKSTRETYVSEYF